MILQKEIFIYGYIPLYSEEIIFQEKNQDFRKNEVRSHGQHSLEAASYLK